MSMVFQPLIDGYRNAGLLTLYAIAEFVMLALVHEVGLSWPGL